MLYAFDYIKKQLQKVTQPWPLPINKSNGSELSRQITKNDNHSEKQCQIVEVKNVFENLWLFLLKLLIFVKKF
jgi:hypothetical protein